MIVKRQNKARVFQLSHSLKSLGRSVGRRNRSSIAHQAIKDTRIRKRVIERMGKLLSTELNRLSSVKVGSMLRDHSCGIVEGFSWHSLLQELEKEVPVTLSLLKQCVHVKRCVHKGQGKGGRGARRMPNKEAAIGMCVAILMRARSQRMNLVQRLMSLLLYGSHAPKQVGDNLIKDVIYNIIIMYILSIFLSSQCSCIGD